MAKYKITSRKGASVRASKTYTTKAAAFRGANSLAKKSGKTYYIYQRDERWKYVGKVRAVKKRVRRDGVPKPAKAAFDTVVYLGTLQVSVNILSRLKG